MDIFIHQREIYKDPYTDSIPDADPEWGSYQYIKTVWSKRSQYCLLIAEGSLESMKICFDVVCSRYFKIDNLTSDIIGQTMFDEASPYYIFKKISIHINDGVLLTF